MGVVMGDEWPTISDETPLDLSEILPRVRAAVGNRRELNILEAENVRHAVVKYLASKPSKRKAPFAFDWVCKLHREMFGDVLVGAGKIRTVDINPGPLPHRVGPGLMSLVGDLAAWEGGNMPIMEQAMMLHYRAVYLHPFTNGNGRWARLLANIWLKQHDAPIVEWPEATLVGTESPARKEYIAALKRADNSEYNDLLELHRRYSGS